MTITIPNINLIDISIYLLYLWWGFAWIQYCFYSSFKKVLKLPEIIYFVLHLNIPFGLYLFHSRFHLEPSNGPCTAGVICFITVIFLMFKILRRN